MGRELVRESSAGEVSALTSLVDDWAILDIA